MKKVVIITAVCLYTLTSYAQLEMYGRYTINGKMEPAVDLHGETKISEKVHLTYFALVEEKWQEALIGVSYSPIKWINLGLSTGTGIEQNHAIIRFGGNIKLSKGKTSLLMLGEKGAGKDNYLYKTVLSYKASEQFTVCAVAWRFHGIGPVVKYTPKKSDWAISFMPAYDPEFKEKRMILGLSLKI